MGNQMSRVEKQVTTRRRKRDGFKNMIRHGRWSKPEPFRVIRCEQVACVKGWGPVPDIIVTDTEEESPRSSGEEQEAPVSALVPPMPPAESEDEAAQLHRDLQPATSRLSNINTTMAPVEIEESTEHSNQETEHDEWVYPTSRVRVNRSDAHRKRDDRLSLPSQRRQTDISFAATAPTMKMLWLERASRDEHQV